MADFAILQENRSPVSPRRVFVPGAPVAARAKSLRFSETLLEHSAAPQEHSSDDFVSDSLTSRPLLHDSSDPAKLLPASRRRKGILKATTHPINVVACAEEGKQRNAPRRHSLHAINVPLDALEKAMAKQGQQAGLVFEADALINAVETLEASLDNEANSSSVEAKGENDNCSPRNMAVAPQPPTPPNSSSSPLAKGSRAFIGLRDVEGAYSKVCNQLRRASPLQPLPAELLDVLRSVSSVIVKCLTRDLENVLNPQAPSLIDSSSSSAYLSSSAGPGATPVSTGKRKKQGRTEAELRRRRVELEVGQAALKLVGIITQSASLREAFPSRMILAFIEMAIRIPGMSTLKSTGDREILAFASWVMGTQTLSLEQLGDTVPRMAVALSHILSHPAKANDKTRRIITETLTAIEHLAANHPRPFLAQSRHFLYQVLRFASSQWAPLRDAAVCALGRITLQGASDFSRNKLGDFVFQYYRTPLPGDSSDPDARKTHLSTLAQWMSGANERNEMPWTLTVSSILPVVAVEKFRQLEDGGPKIWMSHMQTLLHHSSSEMRQLARFAWNHLAYSWIMQTESYIQTKPDKVWAMSTKPFELLTQILTYDNTEIRAPKSAVRARTMIALIYAFSGFLSEQDTLPSLHQHLTFLFDKLVGTHLSALMLSPSDDAVRETGWRVLAAICGARDPQGRSYDPVRLLCRPLLVGAAIRHSTNLTAVVEQSVAEAIQPDEVAAWDSTWLLLNANIMLKLIATALRSAMLVEGAADSSAVPASIERVWRSFLHSVVSAWRGDPMNLSSAIAAAARDVRSLIDELHCLPFSAQLSSIASEIFADLSLPPLPADAVSTVTAFVDVTKGDFTLPEKATGNARALLWLSLAPNWLATVRSAIAEPQTALVEAQLKGLANFIVVPFECCADVPECLAPMLEAVSLLSSATPSAVEVLSLLFDERAAALDGQTLTRVAVALLKNGGDSPLVADVLQQAVSRPRTDGDKDEEAVLTQILNGITELLKQQDTVTDNSVLSLIILEALSAPHGLALEARHALYEALTQRILQTVHPAEKDISAFQSLLVSVFSSGAVDQRMTRPALSFKAFWSSWSEQGAKATDLTNDVLRSIVQGVNAAGASQISTISTIDSQQTIESESTSHKNTSESLDSNAAYDADVSRLETTIAPPSPELISSKAADERVEDVDVSMEMDTKADNYVPESIEEDKGKKRPLEEEEQKQPSSDDEPTLEEMERIRVKRARRMSRSPSYKVSVPSSSQRSSASPAAPGRRDLRRSLSAPSSRSLSPVAREAAPDVEDFLSKMRSIWEERADNEMREQLEMMDEDALFDVLKAARE